VEKESSLLINQAWQPLAGTRQAQIYPYLRKPDLLSSNSCLIRTFQQIILIDAGALAQQTADINRVMQECQQECSRPVLIYLTHCHIDHSLHVGRYRQLSTSAPVWVAAQEDGAGYLSEGDPRKTIAELYGMAFPSLQADIRLLTVQDRKRKARRQINLALGVHLSLRMEAVSMHRDQSIIRQTISMGGGDELEIYPAPGHGPDGICIRVGEILFIGDLLSAANPMVAGISGWSREDLIRTLEMTLWLLDTLPIRLCYPGHGGIIEADKARALLRRLHQKTCRLSDVTEMNEDRLFQITDFALELIDEAEEVFSSIAGRLLYVAHQLEMLEEETAADLCRTAMPMEQIDACLLEFRNLCLSLDAGKIRRVEFAHGALHIVEKVRSLFDPRPLNAILPQSLINRGTSLLLDFIGIAQGYRNLEEFIPTDFNALIEDVSETWQANSHPDTSIIDQADDYETYLASLVRRIGQMPSAVRPALHLTPWTGLPLVIIAAARFSDTLLNFLDWLALSGPSDISMAAGMDQAGPFITIIPRGRDGSSSAPHEEKKINSFRRRFRLCGLLLKPESRGFRLTSAEDADEKK